MGNDPVNLVDPSGLCGTRIEGASIGCQGISDGYNNENKVVSTHRIKVHNSDGSVNRAGVKRTTTSLNKKIKELTENSGFSREFALVATLDIESDEFLFAVLQGPKSSIFSAGNVDPRPYLQTLKNHRLFYASHTHKGLGVIGGGGVAQTLSAWSEWRGPETSGASDRDLAYSRYIKEKVRPYAKFEVFYQALSDAGPRPWRSHKF